MTSTNDIILRPRFKIKMQENNETLLQAFQALKNAQSDFILSRIDDHVFIRFPKHKQHFWSPQLHLEINEAEDNSSIVHGLFGPNPTVWTLFMFSHFIVILIFVAFGIWAYSNWTLDTSYSAQLTVMLLMVIVWVFLYIAGSIGKATSKDEMQELHQFMTTVLRPFKPKWP
ncbi:hypothetical protein [Gaetbulibacter saemankumensis]|uniref:hypothetical protein n=1 Tax=Gaetbulibacter saemankumensis TaxID=311208 RepID=UPI0004012D6B|nr:hypothetical protein [Gaetbulibacter saemankumensis]